MVKLPYLIPTPSYNQSKIFLHRRLYSKIIRVPQIGRPFYFFDVIVDKAYIVGGKNTYPAEHKLKALRCVAI